jgi:glycosyltransferase involved in cell wall biosynthesis
MGLMPLRIVFCITELDPGGAERALVELVERIDRRQFDPMVYCLGPRPAGNAGSLAERIEQAGTPLVTFGASRSWHLPRLLGKLRRQFETDRPEIVQSFLFHANFAASLAARRAGVPHVVTGIRVAERGRPWHLKLARWADTGVDRHVCVSESVREFSRREGGLPAEKLLVIPNGVDAERFAAAAACPLTALGLPLGRRAIVCVGRLQEQKGLPWLFELLPGIFPQLPDHDLVLVGDGPDRGNLERLAAKLGLSERVHFVGYRPNVAEILAASDLLVLPSRWEGMPNVVLEAMAAGKPVVATDVEGVSEALGPASAQQVVRAGHGEAFAAKVRGLLKQPQLAQELGRVNQARVRQHFTWQATVAAYEALYRSLVAPAAAPLSPPGMGR